MAKPRKPQPKYQLTLSQQKQTPFPGIENRGGQVNPNNVNELKQRLFKHQLKKKFQHSLEWEKDQLTIWDNRIMLHQATSFKGNRVMHRITIH